MGAVYKARQVSLDRLVALKVLPSDLSADGSFVARFHREGRAAAAISHPNAVQVYDTGEDRGCQYIAMELLEGESCAAFLRDGGRLAADRAVALMRQVVSALCTIHESGILHRDIKPANILTTGKGVAKLADFGLAKRSGAGDTVTTTGAILGTPLYLPPEVAQGNPFDARSDLYSLGATFYHLLAGRPPFRAANAAELVRLHTSASVTPLTQVAPDAPLELCHIIDRLLRKNPAGRYQTARDLLAALDPLAGTAEDDAEPKAPSGAAARRAPRAAAEARRARTQRQIPWVPILAIGGAAVIALILLLILALR
jgi:serine/threonine-protein kinase